MARIATQAAAGRTHFIRFATTGITLCQNAPQPCLLQPEFEHHGSMVGRLGLRHPCSNRLDRFARNPGVVNAAIRFVGGECVARPFADHWPGVGQKFRHGCVSRAIGFGVEIAADDDRQVAVRRDELFDFADIFYSLGIAGTEIDVRVHEKDFFAIDIERDLQNAALFVRV